MDNQQLTRFERRKQETHSRLMQAAVELIVERGYAGVTIQDITDQADYSRATFYLHFDDIEGLIWEYFNASWRDHGSRAQKLQQEAGSDKPLLYYEILVDFLQAEENRDFYRVIFSGSGPASVYDETKNKFIAEIEKRILKYPELSSSNIPSHLKAHYIYGAMIQSIIWWLEEPNDFSPQNMADMIFQLIAR